jgi:uncharacterized protein YjbI with pentapeptide repeats
MTFTGLHDHDAAIGALLAVARRETLLLAIAIGAIDDDAAAVASARLRWAIGTARHLIATIAPDVAPDAASDDSSSDAIAHHVCELDQVANRAQRWLVSEPPQPLKAISGLVDRLAARRGRRSGGILADHANLVDLDLDGLQLSRISLQGTLLTDVAAQCACLDAADARSSRWQRCRLDRCSLAMAVFTGSTLEHCDLSRANLEGTSWHRAALSQCNLSHALLLDARLDRAVFTDCDLRGADLRIDRSPELATLVGARFVRCDLRETNWAGRTLGGATFIDCKLFGAHGAPAPAGVVIETADLSRLADGSWIATQGEAVASWRASGGAVWPQLREL